MLLFFLIAIVSAKYDLQKDVTSLVDMSVKGVEETVNQRVVDWMAKLRVPNGKFKQRISKFVTRTFTAPAMSEIRPLIEREIYSFRSKSYIVEPKDLISTFSKSISSKVGKIIQSKATIWSNYILKSSRLSGRESRHLLSKRDAKDEPLFPHLFDDENGVMSNLFGGLMNMMMTMPIQMMFENDLAGNAYYYLFQTLIFQPAFNRVMYGYYLYGPDKN